VEGSVEGEGIVEDMCYERRRAEACVDLSAHHAQVNAGERDCVKEGGGGEGPWSPPPLQARRGLRLDLLHQCLPKIEAG
jgi:hypothetical protein